ncbi:hypothetical protein LguiA_006165 [Lonicera macranthoides]
MDLTKKTTNEKQFHFVLVHGSCHGGWCWYKLIALLQSAGHRATALDLAAAGLHPKKMEELSTIYDYMEPLMEFMEALSPEEKVVLVGHSMGGIAVCAAMEKFPKKISVAVFATAYMHGPDLSLVDIVHECLTELASVAHASINHYGKVVVRESFRARRMSSGMRILLFVVRNQLLDHFNPGSGAPSEIEYRYDQGPDKPPTSFHFGTDYMLSKMYHLSPPEDLALASLLVRPCPAFPDPISIKQTSLTHENYGSVKRVYIISGQDKGFTVDLQKWMIEKNPPDEVKEIPDADHMVMLSKPKELFSYLLEIANKYC